jgi:hypothetical protein
LLSISSTDVSFFEYFNLDFFWGLDSKLLRMMYT